LPRAAAREAARSAWPSGVNPADTAVRRYLMARHGYPGVIDADGHVMETDAEIFEYLPPPYRDQTQLFTAPFFPGLAAWHRAASRVAAGRGRVQERPSGQ